MIVHTLVLQCGLSVLSYSECKIAKMFWDFAPGPHWGGLTAPPDSPAAQRFYSLLCLLNWHPPPPPKKKKVVGYGTDSMEQCNCY